MKLNIIKANFDSYYSNLGVGEIFISNNDVYMKTDQSTDCVCLTGASTGTIFSFREDLKVTAVPKRNVELTVYD